MPILPDRTIDMLRKQADLSVNTFGIPCDLYIPNNLDDVEGEDMYATPGDLTYTVYYDQKVWVEWSAKDIVRLRKLGLFTEKEAPITAYFVNVPIITINSYIKIVIRYIPSEYKTDEFEIVDTLAVGTYNAEVLRRFKLAPRRVNN